MFKLNKIQKLLVKFGYFSYFGSEKIRFEILLRSVLFGIFVIKKLRTNLPNRITNQIFLAVELNRTF